MVNQKPKGAVNKPTTRCKRTATVNLRNFDGTRRRFDGHGSKVMSKPPLASGRTVAIVEVRPSVAAAAAVGNNRTVTV